MDEANVVDRVDSRFLVGKLLIFPVRLSPTSVPKRSPEYLAIFPAYPSAGRQNGACRECAKGQQFQHHEKFKHAEVGPADTLGSRRRTEQARSRRSGGHGD